MKTKWYLANLVEFPIIREKGTLEILNKWRPFYWDNMILISATNSEAAYKKAIRIGKEGEYKTINTDGNYLEWKFAGVRELVEIYDELEDGSEIAYSEGYCNNFENIRRLIPPKNKLSIFEFEKRMKLERRQEKKNSKHDKISWKNIWKESKEIERMANKALGKINDKI